MDLLIQLLIEKTSLGYKKWKELYSTKVSVLAVKYLLVILHRLSTDGVSQLAISVVQYTGTWSNIADHTVMNLYSCFELCSSNLLHSLFKYLFHRPCASVS